MSFLKQLMFFLNQNPWSSWGVTTVALASGIALFILSSDKARRLHASLYAWTIRGCFLGAFLLFFGVPFVLSGYSIHGALFRIGLILFAAAWIGAGLFLARWALKSLPTRVRELWQANKEAKKSKEAGYNLLFTLAAGLAGLVLLTVLPWREVIGGLFRELGAVFPAIESSRRKAADLYRWWWWVAALGLLTLAMIAPRIRYLLSNHSRAARRRVRLLATIQRACADRQYATLALLCQNPEAEIQQEAFSALQSCADQDAGTRAFLIKAIESDDPIADWAIAYCVRANYMECASVLFRILVTPLAGWNRRFKVAQGLQDLARTSMAPDFVKALQELARQAVEGKDSKAVHNLVDPVITALLRIHIPAVDPGIRTSLRCLLDARMISPCLLNALARWGLPDDTQKALEMAQKAGEFHLHALIAFGCEDREHVAYDWLHSARYRLDGLHEDLSMGAKSEACACEEMIQLISKSFPTLAAPYSDSELDRLARLEDPLVSITRPTTTGCGTDFVRSETLTERVSFAAIRQAARELLELQRMPKASGEMPPMDNFSSS